MPDFHGVFPYPVTPVDASGQVRGEVLGRLCDDLITSGVHGLTPLSREMHQCFPPRRRQFEGEAFRMPRLVDRME